MTFDEMYGAGSWTAYTKACEEACAGVIAATTHMRQFPTELGVYTEAEWVHPEGEVGCLKVEFRGTVCHADSLELQPALQNHGIATKLTEVLPPLGGSLGIQQWSMFVDPENNPEGTKSMELLGFHENLGDGMKGGTHLPATRLEERVAWVKAGKPEGSEPSWHKELREA